MTREKEPKPQQSNSQIFAALQPHLDEQIEAATRVADGLNEDIEAPWDEEDGPPAWVTPHLLLDTLARLGLRLCPDPEGFASMAYLRP